MAVKTGTLGKVNGQSTVRGWTLNRLSNPKTFTASNTKTGQGARTGAYDWNGTFRAYGGSPLVLPGDAFSFVGHTGESAGDETFTGDAIIDQIAMTINYASQEIVSYAANFSANGPLTEGTGAGADTTYPDAPPACLAVVSAGDDGSEAEIPDLSQVVLTLTSNNPSYVNSSSKVSGKVWTKRRKASKSWSVAITQQSATGVSPLVLDEDVRLKIDVDGAAWILQWGKVGDQSGLTVDMESDSILEVTHNITQNIAPHDETVVGHVLTPAGPWIAVTA